MSHTDRGALADPLVKGEPKPQEMHEYVVTLKRPRRKAPLHLLLAETEGARKEFAQEVKRVAAQEHLDAEVRSVAPSQISHLPAVFMTSTAAFARRIRQHPMVRAVVRDR